MAPLKKPSCRADKAVHGGGGAAAVPTATSSASTQGSTGRTKKKSSSKGLHWSQKELDLLFELIGEVKPTGKRCAALFDFIYFDLKFHF
jgi:hypothetical protein